MFQLTNEERLAIARRVVSKAAGRVPVVAGATFEGTLEDQAKLMNEMGKIATAVVIITNQIAGMEESDDVWIANAQRLLDLTGDIPVGTYETPVPRVRWVDCTLTHCWSIILMVGV
jgi:4-hydroxy-tetrahydrodipicolinate synthase